MSHPIPADAYGAHGSDGAMVAAILRMLALVVFAAALMVALCRRIEHRLSAFDISYQRL
jgi:hypothetical protein